MREAVRGGKRPSPVVVLRGNANGTVCDLPSGETSAARDVGRLHTRGAYNGANSIVLVREKLRGSGRTKARDGDVLLSTTRRRAVGGAFRFACCVYVGRRARARFVLFTEELEGEGVLITRNQNIPRYTYIHVRRYREQRRTCRVKLPLISGSLGGSARSCRGSSAVFGNCRDSAAPRRATPTVRTKTREG